MTRWTLWALAVLGSFQVGRLISPAVIGPLIADALTGSSDPVFVLAVGIAAIAIDVGLAALVAIPSARFVLRR